jgi:hypothetical protein
MAWMWHSTNLSMEQHCSTFVCHNFGRCSDAESFEKWAQGKADELDIGWVEKQSTAPKQTGTKQLICEMLTFLKICVETPSRKEDVNRLWNILPELMTELTNKDKIRGSSTKNSSQEDQELEKLLAQIVDGELQVAIDDSHEAATTEETAEEEDNNCDEVADDLGGAGMAHLGCQNDNKDHDNEFDNKTFWMTRQPKQLQETKKGHTSKDCD